jgi:ribosomal protein S18 acetylase RimI-like enzyme
MNQGPSLTQKNAMHSLQQISLRPASSEDREFLFKVYANTRREEMKPWGWNPQQQEVFLRMQFDVRRRSYATAYPLAEESIIVHTDLSVGSMIASRGSAEIRLVDIAILPEYRNRGIGGGLIGTLIAEAARSATLLRLSILQGNPAIHLYERLGFVVSGRDSMYLEMEYRPVPNAEKIP